jgi:hypothetical protein
VMPSAIQTTIDMACLPYRRVPNSLV